MSTVVTWETNSSSSEQTEQLAERLGKVCRGGEVIELISDVGGGKTTFTRGLVRGIGSTDMVASPTFTLSRVYDAGALRVYHFDFYRLDEAGIIGDELAECIGQSDVITVVEWADIVQHVLPEQRLSISIELRPDDSRALMFRAPEHLDYLIAGARNA